LGPSPTFSVITDSFNGAAPVRISTSTYLGGTSSVNTTLPYPIVTESNASSTSAGALGSFAGLPNFFANKIPWGYAWQIRDYYNAAATTSTEFGDLAVDFQSLGVSTGTKAFLPGRIVFFGTSTVTTYLNGTILNSFNTLASAVVTLLWVAFIRRRASSVFQTV